jgi:DNA modification methylase
VNPTVIGRATLYLGDCRDILPTLGKVDAVVTDPPYSSGGFQEAGKGGGSVGQRDNAVIIADNLSTRGYQRLLREILNHFASADEAFIFTDWKMWTHTTDGLEDGGFRVRAMIVWDKVVMGMGSPWRNRHELIAYGKKSSAGKDGGKAANVVAIPRAGTENHPTEKPVDLMCYLMQHSQAQIVCDPFMGSGSTGIAALALGKDFIGIERDPKHFAVACKRIEEAQRQGDMFREAAA